MTWKLGDLTVHRIGFGAKRLAGNGPFDPASAADRQRAIDLVRLAVELGVDHIDTAAFYPSYATSPRGDFASLHCANTLIREALAPYRSNVVVATKVGPVDGGLARPDQLRRLVEQDLRQLGRDHLDLVYLRQHGLDSVAEHFGALADMRDAGLIRHLGLSNVKPDHLTQAEAIAPVVAVQNSYGVDYRRRQDGLLEVCGAKGIAFVPFFALAGDQREAGGVASNDVVASIARAHRATPAQVRLAWTLSRGPHVLAIPGTGNGAHLAENMDASDLRLTSEDLARLD